MPIFSDVIIPAVFRPVGHVASAKLVQAGAEALRPLCKCCVDTLSQPGLFWSGR